METVFDVDVRLRQTPKRSKYVSDHVVISDCYEVKGLSECIEGRGIRRRSIQGNVCAVILNMKLMLLQCGLLYVTAKLAKEPVLPQWSLG